MTGVALPIIPFVILNILPVIKAKWFILVSINMKIFQKIAF